MSKTKQQFSFNLKFSYNLKPNSDLEPLFIQLRKSKMIRTQPGQKMKMFFCWTLLKATMSELIFMIWILFQETISWEKLSKVLPIFLRLKFWMKLWNFWMMKLKIIQKLQRMWAVKLNFNFKFCQSDQNPQVLQIDFLLPVFSSILSTIW